MSSCSQCGVEFFCGAVDGVVAETCWCMALPLRAGGEWLLNADGSMQNCLCPHCMHAQRTQATTGPQRSSD